MISASIKLEISIFVDHKCDVGTSSTILTKITHTHVNEAVLHILDSCSIGACGVQFARYSGTMRIFYVRDVSPRVLFDAFGVVDKNAFERNTVVVIFIPRCRENLVTHWVSFERVCKRE